jgi:branched-chain amino acid transport system permease protein
MHTDDLTPDATGPLGHPFVNRREQTNRRGPGLPVTWPVLIATTMAVVALVVGPLGRNSASTPVYVLLAAIAAVAGAGAALFDLTSRLGKMQKTVLLLGCASFLVLFPLNRANSTLVDLMLFCVFGITVIGLNLTQGFAGQVTLAQAAFLGIGAYLSQMFDQGLAAKLGPVSFTFPNLPFLLAMLVAVVICFAMGIAVGFPALRVHGPWLAFVTLAFNALVVLVLNNETGLTNGPQGIRALRSNFRLFGIDMLDSTHYYYVCLAFLAIVTIAVWWIVRSPWGRSFRAIRDNPGRASSLGVNVRTYTLLAFAIGSALAGLAGALYAPAIEFIEPGSFGTAKSFSFLLATVVGGVGTLVGPFIGTVFITILENRLRFLGESYLIAFALFVIGLMLVAPNGIAGSAELLRQRITARRERADNGGDR